MSILPLLLSIISVFCAVVPILSFLAIAWWLDRYDREPLWIVGLTFLWGALGATLLSLVGNTTAHLGLAALLGEEQASTWTPVVVAPLVEEPTKAVVLFLLLLSRHFDNTTDGFVYGAAAGLGFGMTENLLYFWQAASMSAWDPMEGLRAWATTVAMRTFYSALLHATASAVLGAGLGFARFRGWPLRLLVVPACVALAMGIHALWNGLLTLDEQGGMSGPMTRLNLVLFPAEAVMVFLVFQLALWSERRDIRAELQAEARQGTLPADHVPILSSYSRRFGSTWAPRGVPQDAYVRAATTLAFRRRQSRMRPDDAFYREEVDRLRREVQGLLATGA